MGSLATTLIKLHRFLNTHLFYPLLLSSLLATILFAGRVIRSDSLAFINLVWNLFLAWIPYLISLWSAAIASLFPRQWWLLVLPGGMWLIFFPNAPYIITDFLHLEERPRVPLWYDILLLATYAWSGLFLAVASLRTMQDLVQSYLGRAAGWIFAACALGMGGLGIYLGRFSRFNSWDLLLQPKAVLADIALLLLNPLSNLRFFGFTSLFTAFLLVVYLSFMAAKQTSQRER